MVNAISVLIMSLNNSVKASEKFECFKRLSQQFMILSQEIEGMESIIDKEKYTILLLKLWQFNSRLCFWRNTLQI